jgi:hypothetical protein
MIVWSCGGGTQSADIALKIIKGILPKPDISLISDTSRECSETWLFLNNYLQPALNAVGVKIEIVPHSFSKVDLNAHNGDMLLPLYTRKNNRLGMMPAFCSKEWKQLPIRRYLKQIGVYDCDVWLGMSTDEIERMKPSGLNWYRHIYPLITIVPTSRTKCYSEVFDFFGVKPPRSRCWCCPNQTSGDWMNLYKNCMGDFSLAIELDEQIRKSDKYAYIHFTGLPLLQGVEKNLAQPDIFESCESGYCFV